MIQFEPNWVGLLTLLVSVILPVVVGLVTKRVTDPGHKAILLALLAALTGFLSELLNALTTGDVYDVFSGLLTFVAAFIIGVALHYGLWKPTGVSHKAQEVGTHRG